MISPLLLDLVADLAEARGRPPLIGIAGAQGSGKTTLARAAAQRLGGVAFSLDDVYLTKAERAALGREVHPLLATRGPPGTHDLALAERTIDALMAGAPTALPRFDKLADDRAEPLRVDAPVRVVLMEGWCLGATPQDAAALAEPVNILEGEEDEDGAWRTYVNDALAGAYQTFFGRFDAVLHLAAPSFDTVLDWRCEQEAGLLGLKREDLPPARREALVRFIQHFERITRHMLDGGTRATATVWLGADRSPREWTS
ncbi:kinase [Caulobacter mirabilis]|uniref:Kinase n=1 Tax=Caulobacter mirabilis TaxID=69666 RepID=A0A2D2AVF6_9CAUL|nr:kinase [Caulobacter mirabilis]ATQ41983.1 kinase [Caulobacter mirabilis]